MRPIQYFSDEYLEQASLCSPTEIAQFLEDIRLLSSASKPPTKSKLISVKVPQQLLDAFRIRCGMESIPYQTKIKELMLRYITAG